MIPSFYTTVIQKSAAFHSTTPCRDIRLLEPVTRDAVFRVIGLARESGVTLQVLETYRSQELQEHYYERGATQLRTVGVHHYGVACDLGIVIAGQVNWKADYSILGKLAKRAGLVWGGDWGSPERFHSFRDYDHVQRIAVADQDKLFSGSWYPSPSYVVPEAG
ncbi:MAG: M15 family metallopeptidase [Patescibacteria group bacterium]|nr:M15 family metallopeptidase [Patescibacteria group bacterium]